MCVSSGEPHLGHWTAWQDGCSRRGAVGIIRQFPHSRWVPALANIHPWYTGPICKEPDAVPLRLLKSLLQRSWPLCGQRAGESGTVPSQGGPPAPVPCQEGPSGWGQCEVWWWRWGQGWVWRPSPAVWGLCLSLFAWLDRGSLWKESLSLCHWVLVGCVAEGFLWYQWRLVQWIYEILVWGFVWVCWWRYSIILVTFGTMHLWSRVLVGCVVENIPPYQWYLTQCMCNLFHLA